VEETHRILRNIVAQVLESPECKSLQQYTHLKREISVTAGRALEKFKEDARKMVVTMVEMERSYLTAEVFREILQQNGRSSESGDLIRTLSGRPVGSPLCLCFPPLLESVCVGHRGWVYVCVCVCVSVCV
jgi:hypothetical protein